MFKFELADHVAINSDQVNLLFVDVDDVDPLLCYPGASSATSSLTRRIFFIRGYLKA